MYLECPQCKVSLFQPSSLLPACSEKIALVIVSAHPAGRGSNLSVDQPHLDVWMFKDASEGKLHKLT